MKAQVRSIRINTLPRNVGVRRQLLVFPFAALLTNPFPCRVHTDFPPTADSLKRRMTGYLLLFPGFQLFKTLLLYVGTPDFVNTFLQKGRRMLVRIHPDPTIACRFILFLRRKYVICFRYIIQEKKILARIALLYKTSIDYIMDIERKKKETICLDGISKHMRPLIRNIIEIIKDCIRRIE